MLSVWDTLTIVHRQGTQGANLFPVLLARGLELKKAVGLGIVAVASEERFRPRDYWFSPPYEELDGYDRARTIFIRMDGPTSTWPDTAGRSPVCGSRTRFLRPPTAAYARGFETTTGLIDRRGAFLSGATFWIPSRPDERFTFRATLRAPIGWRAVSQGKLVSNADRMLMHQDVWDCPQPMEEIYFIAGPYQARTASTAAYRS
jgi:hypothetical protein